MIFVTYSMDPGTDVTSLILKTFQSKQIQIQLDLTHNLYKEKKLENIQRKYQKNKFSKKRRKIKMDDLDERLRRSNFNQSQEIPHRPLTNAYAHKIFEIYRTYQDGTGGDARVKFRIEETLLNEPLFHETSSVAGQLEEIDNYFNNISSFIDLRKSKTWVSYMLSDNVRRIGSITNHPVYNTCPGWVIDALIISSKNNLHLIYSTDLRGTNSCFGQLVSLINIHNLLDYFLEDGADETNYTIVLIHLAGILTETTLNPINRQGIRFPASILQKTTFENVKKQLLNASQNDENYDSLCSFVSPTIVCLPHKTGTNAFNLIQKI